MVLAQEALAQLELGCVMLMPMGVAPHRELADDPGAEVRFELAAAAAAGDERFEASRMEVDREGPSYTVDTLAALHEEHPDDELVWILGGDQAATLRQWREPERVLELATIAATERGAWRRAGIVVEAGDAVLIRTGWARRWNEPARFVDGDAGCPGLDEDGARWLLARGVRLVGNDTPFFEVHPRKGDENVHALLIADNGVQIIENLDLERLAADRIASFLLVVLPLPLVGATGSPVRPIAIL
jgi:hypothetical protein